MGGVTGTIPLLAQRAVSEDPRWTRAVLSILRGALPLLEGRSSEKDAM